ncbi:MAG: hypothetical protein LUD83_06275 [Clostridiales bacterium]|nr:hypothetical protein [Clostridiales bacterium]
MDGENGIKAASADRRRAQPLRAEASAEKPPSGFAGSRAACLDRFARHCFDTRNQNEVTLKISENNKK